VPPGGEQKVPFQQGSRFQEYFFDVIRWCHSQDYSAYLLLPGKTSGRTVIRSMPRRFARTNYSQE
jgi:hypothetical protein